MKNALLVAALSAVATQSTYAQFSLEHMANFDNVNFTTVQVNDDGTAHAFGYGITDECESIYTYSCNDFETDWELVSGCDPVDWPESYLSPMSAHFFDNNHGLVVMSQDNSGYNTPGIYKTNDGGESWYNVFELVKETGADGVNDIAFMDENNGIALSFYIRGDDNVYQSNVIRTTDGGETWVEETEGMFLDTEFMKIVAIEGVYYIFAQSVIDWDQQSWMVYKSVDGGAEWTEVYREETPLYYSFPGAIYFLSAEVGYVAIQDGITDHSNLKKTTDGGLTWTDVPVSTEVLPEKMSFNDLYFFDENTGIVVAGNHCNDDGCYRGYAVLSTQNGGETWKVEATSPFAAYALYDVDFDENSGIGYIVGGDIDTERGNIFKISVDNLKIEEEIQQNQISVYPNPSQGTVQFNYSELNSAKLLVYDLSGKQVHQQTNVTASTPVSLSLPNGVYLFSLTTDQNTYQGKIEINH